VFVRLVQISFFSRPAKALTKTNQLSGVSRSVPQGRLKVRLVQISFFESVHPPPLMPRCAATLNLVIPTGADPDFRIAVPATPLSWAGNRGSVGEGPAVSLGPQANLDKGYSTNPILFEIQPAPHNQRITCTPSQVYSLIWTELKKLTHFQRVLYKYSDRKS
jgi:hypothetical protein